jgi:hypothetical protein
MNGSIVELGLKSDIVNLFDKKKYKYILMPHIIRYINNKLYLFVDGLNLNDSRWFNPLIIKYNNPNIDI